MLNGYKVIALCIAKVNDIIHMEYVTAIRKALKTRGYRLFIYQTCSDLYWETLSEVGEVKLFELIDYDIVDAVIVFDETIKNKKVVERIHNRAVNNVPVIYVDAEYEGGISVFFDYRNAFIRLINHVIEEHHITDLHFMAGLKDNDFSNERLYAFRDTLKAHGIPFDDSMVSYGDFWSGPTTTAMEKIIASGHIPKAIICANDTMAITVCTILQNNGYRVPEDIIVTGFDGIDEGKFATPSITTCECNYSDMANKILDILVSYFEGGNYDRKRLIEFDMLYAQSCGCSDKRKYNAASLINSLNDRLNSYEEDERILHEIAAKIQSCNFLSDVSREMHNFRFTDVCFMLNKEFLADGFNPLDKKVEGDFTDEMYVLFHTDSTTDSEGKFYPRKRIIPGIEKYIEKDVPVLFAALNYSNRPFGFMCMFCEINMEWYLHVAQYVYAMDNALTGFWNQRYQSFMNRKLDEFYRYDPLTSLYNRNGFERYIDEIAKELTYSDEETIYVAVADLDGLKHINDTYGHKEGDNAIVVVGNAMRNSKPMDKICARIGGDELVAIIVSEDDTDVEGIMRQSIQEYLLEYNKAADKPYDVSISIGFCRAKSSEFDYDENWKLADRRMYDEKITKHNSRQ